MSRAVCSVSLVALFVAGQAAGAGTQGSAPYRIEPRRDRVGRLADRFNPRQLGLLEKLNRADTAHLERLPQLVVPIVWDNDELEYSRLPRQYAAAISWPTFLVVYLPGQLFGAYESGALVRWGPVSSGRRSHPTRSGLFALNWRSEGRVSTVDPNWFMRWYFNFSNHEGLAFHAYSLPGSPSSHGCIRLLARDAQWLFEWGRTWTLDAGGTRVLRAGTPVFIIEDYDFDATPPWRSLTWLAHTVALPTPPASGWTDFVVKP